MARLGTRMRPEATRPGRRCPDCRIRDRGTRNELAATDSSTERTTSATRRAFPAPRWRQRQQRSAPETTPIPARPGLPPEAPGGQPTVAVALAARDEEKHLEPAVRSILAQPYPRLTKLVIAVAPSTDNTRSVAEALAEEDDRIVVIDNPDGRTAQGFNAAVGLCDTDYVALMNAHCEVSDDYLGIGVTTAEAMGASNVGGRQHATAGSRWQTAIAAAVNSPIGVGAARHHYDDQPGEIESVPLGIFRRRVFVELGGFDETQIRNQDYELNWRIRSNGLRVWYDPRLVVTYRGRDTLGGLARQYWDYGRYKRRMMQRWPRSIRWHHLVPPSAVVVVIAAVVAALVWNGWFALVPALYVLGVYGATKLVTRNPDGSRAGVAAAAASMVMHGCWGAGVLVGPRWDRRNGPQS